MPRWLPSRSTPLPSRAPSPSPSTQPDQDAPNTSSAPSSDPVHSLQALNLNLDLWPSFAPSPSPSSSSPWTLGLGLSPDPAGGLSPPPRARRASARSLGLRTIAAHPLRRVRSLESSASGGGSSAGSGTGGGGEQFAWRPREREEDTASDQISSPGTFGGEGDRRRGQSSISTTSASAPSSTNASVMPRSLLSSEREASRDWSEWGSSPRTGGGMSLGPPPRSRERMREQRDVSGGTTGARTFDERSWEFKVAEALFLSSPARSPSSSTVSPSSSASPAGSSTARLPLPLPKRQRSVPLFAALSPPRPPSSHLFPPPTSSSNTRLRAYKSSPEVLRPSPPPRALTPAAAAGESTASSSDSDDEIWHDAASSRSPSPIPQPRPRPRTVTLPVRPSSRGALEWSAYPPSRPVSGASTSGRRDSFRAVSVYLAPSPPLSPRDTLLDFSSAHQHEDPFADHHQYTSLEVETFEEGEEDIRLPFPIQPLYSTLSPSQRSSVVHPPRNFLSPPPLRTRDRDRKPSASPSPPTRTTPQRRISLPFGLDRLPPGAWLFLLGFLMPVCWWVGAFYPSLPSLSPSRTTTGEKRAEGKGERRGPKGIKKSLSLTDLPSRRSSWRGKLPLLGAPSSTKRETEPTVWVWRRRNRAMSVVSLVVLGVCVGVGVWSGVQQRRGSAE